MIIKTLTVENFRMFKRQGFRFNSRFNVLIGRNGKGKTQILDALSIILSVYQIKFLRRETIERGIQKDEVRLEQTRFNQEDGAPLTQLEPIYPVSVSAQIFYRDTLFEQTCTKKNAKGRTTFGGATPFSQLAAQELQKKLNKEQITLPFLGYYGAGRLKPLHRRQTSKSKLDSGTIDGYKDGLDPKVLFDDVEQWIKDRILNEILNKRFDVELEIVRKALRVTIPQCSDICYDPSSRSVCVQYENGVLEPLQNLSDGYRCMIKMVFDIARRIAVMNAPILGVKALEETSGVVLIDEIDLYLHPEWQRSVVDDLKNAFPKLQFIVTTHSPFIIQSLKPGELIDLENCNGQISRDVDEYKDFAEPAPENEYVGCSPEDITEYVMGVALPQRSKRSRDMYDAAQKFYDLLDEVEKLEATSPNDEAEIKSKGERLNQLERLLDETSAPFSDDLAFTAFLDRKRLGVRKEK